MKLDERQAFEAMRRFLADFYERTDGDMATLMTDIQPEPDGSTFDPAAWDDWLGCIRAVMEETE